MEWIGYWSSDMNDDMHGKVELSYIDSQTQIKLLFENNNNHDHKITLIGVGNITSLSHGSFGEIYLSDTDNPDCKNIPATINYKIITTDKAKIEGIYYIIQNAQPQQLDNGSFSLSLHN